MTPIKSIVGNYMKVKAGSGKMEVGRKMYQLPIYNETTATCPRGT